MTATALRRDSINCMNTAKRFYEITEDNYNKLFGHGLGAFNKNQIGMFLVKENNGYWYLATRENWFKSRVRRDILNESILTF